MPHILLLTETYYPVVGGGEIQAQALVEGLTACGLAVTVLTRRTDIAQKKEEYFGAIRVKRLPPVGAAHYKKWGLLFSSLFTLMSLRYDYDLIFVSGFRVVGLSSVLVGKLFGKPVVLKADSLGEMSGDFFTAGLNKLGLKPQSVLVKAFLGLRNKILRQASQFVAISSEITTELRTHGVQDEQITTIPNSVDITRFHPVTAEQKQALRHKLGLPHDHKLVIYTGRLVSYKGLPLLIQVWRDIQAQHKQVMLVLVGAGGLDIHNCEADLRAFVAEHKLENSVVFTGAVSNIPAYLQAADIFVFPTENEAFGISLIEAMACGLPVISTPVGGVKDILQHQENGLIVAAGHFEQLYEGLSALLRDRELSARLAQAGRRTTQDRYSMTFVTGKYIDLFIDLISIGC